MQYSQDLVASVGHCFDEVEDMDQRRFSGPAEEEDVIGAGDRREGDRYRTVWRIAKVLRNGDAVSKARR